MKDQNRKTKSSRNSLRLLGIFFIVVISAVLLSLGHRIFTLVSESKFDGQHSFLVSFIYKNDVDIIGINPSQKSFSHLQVRGGKSSKENIQESGVLTDSTVTLAKPFVITNVSDYFIKAAWHQDKIVTDLTIYDLSRLGLVTKNIAKDSLNSESVHIPFDQAAASSMLEQLFLDDAIDADNQTVAIVNGTGVPGIGTRLEQPLSSLGVNIISVTNSDSVKSSSKITYMGKKSYTVKRLSSLLHLPTEQITSQGISDIIILIGKDRSQTDQF